MRAVAKSVLVLLACLISVELHADVVAGWDVDGVDVGDGVGIVTNLPPYSFVVSTSEVDQVTATLSLGAGVSPSTSAGKYGFKIAGDDQTNSLAGAIAMEHYMEFSLTVAEGYELNLSSIEIIGEGTSTACSNVVLMSSVDGFVAGKEMATVFPANVNYSLDTKKGAFGDAVDLSAKKYQHLTGSVAFRIYGWNSAAGSGSIRIRNLKGMDLVVNGTVAPVSTTGEGEPQVSIHHSNGRANVAVLFGDSSVTNCCLQYCSQLTDSAGWSVIAGPFSQSTNLFFDADESCGFYRLVSGTGEG